MKVNSWIAGLSCFVSCCTGPSAQQASDALGNTPHSSTLTLMKRDGTCIYGPISKLDATAITVQTPGQPPILIQRDDLLQVTQGDALLFTSSNSWLNVEQAAAHVYPREAFVLRLKSGKAVTGKPTKVSSGTITLKHGLITSDYNVAEIETVDYLRLKPESDQLDYLAQEAPVLLFFDPEFYYRSVGLEGRIPVRLYDDAKPKTAPPPSQCSKK